MVNSGQKNLTPNAQIIFAEDPDGCTAMIANGGSYDVMLGNSEVTKNNGFILKPNVTVVIDFGPNEPVYGVTNQGETSKVSYFLTKNT